MTPPPPLVLVHGTPASGKSTLARHLATALRPDAGVLVPDAPREILRFIGWIERVMANGA